MVRSIDDLERWKNYGFVMTPSDPEKTTNNCRW